MKKYSLAIDGKVYISSNRASEIAGYSKDYVGQLCRSGKLECRMVGRNWYVDETSLRRHQSESTKANQTSFGSSGLMPTFKPRPARVSEPVPNMAMAPVYVAKTPISRKASLVAVIALIFAVGGISLAALFSPASRESSVATRPVFNSVSDTDNTANVYQAAQGGLVVLPSQGSANDAKLAQSIRNSFSDNVSVAPGKDGTVGVITPEFRSVKGHDFMYVMVPVKTSSTSPVDDSQ